MKLEVGNKVKYRNNIEKITDITFEVNVDMIDYCCAELTIGFESGEFYYNEIQSFEDNINEIRKDLYEIAENVLEKVSD